MQHQIIGNQRFGMRADQNFAAGGKLDGIAHQIDEHLPQSRWVGQHPIGKAGVNIGDEFEPLAMRLHCQRFECAADCVAQAELNLFEVEFARFDF